MTRSQISENTRFQLLRMLRENPEISQRDLAKAISMSVESINYVSNAFLHKGIVKCVNSETTRDKRQYAQVLPRTGMAERAKLTGSFLARKVAEYEALREEIELIMLGSQSYRKRAYCSA